MVGSKKIFISHSHKDAFISNAIFDALVSMGIEKDAIFNTSHNDTKLEIGDTITEEIQTAIKTAAVGILICSSNYYNSPICMNEMGALWFANKKILPVLCKMKGSDLQGVINENMIYSTLDETTLLTLLSTINDTLELSTTRTAMMTLSKNIMNKIENELDDLTEFAHSTIFTARETICSENTPVEALIMYEYIIETSQSIFYPYDDERWKIFISKNELKSLIRYEDCLNALVIRNQVDKIKDNDFNILFELNSTFKMDLLRISPKIKKTMNSRIEKEISNRKHDLNI